MPKAAKTNQLFERFVVCGLSPELLCTVAGEAGFLGTNFRYRASLIDQLPHTHGDNSGVPPQLPAVRACLRASLARHCTGDRAGSAVAGRRAIVRAARGARWWRPRSNRVARPLHRRAAPQLRQTSPCDPQCCLPSGVDILLKADVSPDTRHPRTYTVVLTGACAGRAAARDRAGRRAAAARPARSASSPARACSGPAGRRRLAGGRQAARMHGRGIALWP
jgi:hypothetical protein